eukprot:gene7828-biopygen21085
MPNEFPAQGNPRAAFFVVVGALRPSSGCYRHPCGGVLAGQLLRGGGFWQGNWNAAVTATFRLPRQNHPLRSNHLRTE